MVLYNYDTIALFRYIYICIYATRGARTGTHTRTRAPGVSFSLAFLARSLRKHRRQRWFRRNS